MIYNFSPNIFKNKPPINIKQIKYPIGAIQTQINLTYRKGIKKFYEIKQSNE
jgi:hypothetical protein